MSSSAAIWKCSTLVLAVALVVGVGGPWVGEVQAAGPARLTKALAALKTSKKMLDEAKEPPPGPHAQSVAAVNQAIAAVEREIKAYEAAAAKAKPAGSAEAKPGPKKEAKPKAPAAADGDGAD